jgi:DNA-binding HxlR family transcriptional regulator
LFYDATTLAKGYLMRRKSLKGAACPIAKTLDVIGDWWSLLIVRDALRGTRRFSEFEKSLGVSKNILARRLRTLVGHGILEQSPVADGSAYQEYLLTPMGRGLFPVIVALRQFGEESLYGAEPCRTVMVDRKSGQPVRKLELRASNGRLLKPGETMLVRREA